MNAVHRMLRPALAITIVIPYHSGDLDKVHRLGPWMRRLSGDNRIAGKLLLCAKGGSESFPTDLFQGLFDEIATMRILDGPTGWPQGCNHQFLALAQWIDKGEFGIESWYYFEPDNLPLRHDWWKLIAQEYQACGKPFWGMEQPNVEDGKVNGTHMVGTGIYPRDAWSRIKVYQEIEREKPNRPWDVLHRHEVNPQCHFTKLVMHQAGMSNYTPDGFANYPTHFDGAGRFPLDIPKETCVLHGCKDSSLLDAWGVKIGLPQKKRR